MFETLGAVAASLVFAGAAVWFVRSAGAEWRWFALGVASWALAVVLKIPLSLGLQAAALPAMLDGILMGVVSAGCELGMAALFLRGRTLSLPNVLAFGAAIGAFEVLFVLPLAALEVAVDDAPLPTGAAALFFFLERAITLVGHTASRVLVYVALRTRTLLPVGVAVVAFACVDGVAAFGDSAGWDWENTLVRGWFTLFIAVVGAVEAGVAWWAWRRAHGASTAPVAR